MFAMFGATVLVPILVQGYGLPLSIQTTLLFAGLGTLYSLFRPYISSKQGHTPHQQKHQNQNGAIPEEILGQESGGVWPFYFCFPLTIMFVIVFFLCPQR